MSHEDNLFEHLTVLAGVSCIGYVFLLEVHPFISFWWAEEDVGVLQCLTSMDFLFHDIITWFRFPGFMFDLRGGHNFAIVWSIAAWPAPVFIPTFSMIGICSRLCYLQFLWSILHIGLFKVNLKAFFPFLFGKTFTREMNRSFLLIIGFISLLFLFLWWDWSTIGLYNFLCFKICSFWNYCYLQFLA